MIARCVKVMKKNGVAVGGSVRITPETGVAPVRTKAVSGTSSPTAAVPQQARLMESNDEYAIIEVICGCGTKSFIQCNYGASRS